VPARKEKIMPRKIENPNAPERGFYQRRISAKQMRLLTKESADLTTELNVLRIKARVLLDMLEGITFYTDLDMSRLSLLNTIVNSIIRAKIKNLILTHKDLTLDQLIAAELDKDPAGWGQA
jgi:hypothetical protein